VISESPEVLTALLMLLTPAALLRGWPDINRELSPAPEKGRLTAAAARGKLRPPNWAEAAAEMLLPRAEERLVRTADCPKEFP
jgi:hypothetical protein